MAGTVSQLAIFAYCAAMGFVAAATIATFYQWVTSEKAELFSARASVPGVVLVVLVSMFAGPFIVASKVLAGIRAGEIRVIPAIVGAAVAGMWSVCAGIFYVSLLVTA